jgi:hypothetical protein
MDGAPRYFLFGLEDTSGPCSALGIEALEAVESSSAGLHAVVQYGNAVLDLGRIDEGELHEKV